MISVCIERKKRKYFRERGEDGVVQRERWRVKNDCMPRGELIVFENDTCLLQ